MTKKGQVAIFIIIAIVIALGIVIFFIVRSQIKPDDIPLELSPVFDYYQTCIEQEGRLAIELAGLQGGRVEVPDYFPGSEWAPFSSNLNFLGGPIPYWYYISANGIIKEQAPTKSQMEAEIAEYVRENMANCDFERFYQQGYSIQAEEPVVQVQVEDTKTKVTVTSTLSVSKAEQTAKKTTHNVEIQTKLGKFYETARNIYNKQRQEAFLEKYALDTLYSYAPVDGVKIQCAPKVWSTTKVMKNLRKGLEENFKTIKFEGDYYDLKNKDRKYFVVDQEVDEAVNVMYAKNWPTRIEITGEGVDDEIMLAETIGTQEGMSAMGFCYAPYHFVYDVSFPALIQIYNNNEIFQFPVVVVIDKNVPRKAKLSAIPSVEEPDLCRFKTQNVEISVFNANLNRIDANVSYECFNQRCRLGQTKNGRYVGMAPACVNGFVHVRAGGYVDKKELFSTNDERAIDVILEREYELDTKIKVGGQSLQGTAIVSFVRDDGKTSTISYPALDKIKLSEGSYEVKVYVYGNSSITLPANTKQKCVDVPKRGLLGFFGSTEEKCFEIKTPQTKIDYALIGGGISQIYVLESELEKGKVTISVDRLPTPNSIEVLQQNFEIFKAKEVRLNFNE